MAYIYIYVYVCIYIYGFCGVPSCFPPGGHQRSSPAEPAEPAEPAACAGSPAEVARNGASRCRPVLAKMFFYQQKKIWKMEHWDFFLVGKRWNMVCFFFFSHEQWWFRWSGYSPVICCRSMDTAYLSMILCKTWNFVKLPAGYIHL